MGECGDHRTKIIHLAKLPATSRFILLAIFVLCSNSSQVTAEGGITIGSWGGSYTKSQVKAYHEPFTAKTGIKVNSVDYSGGIAEVKAQVEAGNVSWDIVDVELSDAVRGCDEGLFEKIDASTLPAGADGTPAQEDFLPGTLHECAVANIVWSTIYAYDDTKIGNKKPTTMADFFDTKTWAGKRGLRKGPKPNLEFALIADGVAAKDVYTELAKPEGIDRAFAKLSTIKDSVVWWDAGAQPPQLLADGEVLMTTAYNGRIFNAVAAENKPFVIVWDGQVWDIDLWAIPKGAPNKDNAMAFLKFSTETEQLANQAKYIAYGPARKSSVPLVGKYEDGKIDMAPQMPTAPANLANAVQNDFEWWADNQDKLNERFQKWIEKPKSTDELATVNILFGTNRDYAKSNPIETQFGTNRGNLVYGWSSVSIPKSHIRAGFETSHYPYTENKIGKHLKITNLQLLEEIAFINTIKEKIGVSSKSGFLFVHGFATTFENAALRTAQLAFDLQPFGGVPMFFSWPSKGKTIPLINYTADETNADWAKNDLVNFMKATAKSDLTEIHLIAHSMGNRILLPALARLEREAPALRAKYKEIILAAPDVDAATFTRDFASILAKDPSTVTIYVSKGDKALSASRKIHAHRRLGDSSGEITVFSGIDTIDVSDLDAGFLGHSHYAEHNSVLADMYYIFKAGFRPHERCCLSKVQHSNGYFWRMNGQ